MNKIGKLFGNIYRLNIGIKKIVINNSELMKLEDEGVQGIFGTSFHHTSVGWL